MVDHRRLWRAENQDISIKGNPYEEIYLVYGTQGDVYEVNLDEPSCSCPDWHKRSPKDGCKHILHVKVEEGLIDPVPSAKTNFGNPKHRSKSDYPSNWAELSKRTKKRDNWTCQKCGDKGGPHGNARLEAHHMKPKSRGGKDKLHNLITLCNPCHENEHGHIIPSGSELTPNTDGNNLEGPTYNQFPTSESGDKEPKEPDRPEKDSGISQQSSSGTPSPTSEQELKSSPSNSQTSTPDSTRDKVKIDSSTSLRDMPNMLESDTRLIHAIRDSLFWSGVLFVVFGLVVHFLSLGIFAWIAVTILSILVYLFLQIVSIIIIIKLKIMKDMNDQLKPLLEELERARGESMKKRKLNRIRDLFEHSNDLVSSLDPYLTEEYIEWLSQSQERLKYIEN